MIMHLASISYYVNLPEKFSRSCKAKEQVTAYEFGYRETFAKKLNIDLRITISMKTLYLIRLLLRLTMVTLKDQTLPDGTLVSFSSNGLILI